MRELFEPGDVQDVAAVEAVPVLAGEELAYFADGETEDTVLGLRDIASASAVRGGDGLLWMSAYGRAGRCLDTGRWTIVFVPGEATPLPLILAPMLSI